MASQRTSDENLNPQEDNLSAKKRRLSVQEKRKEVMFQKSGMKRGAIFQYLITKKNQESRESNGSSNQTPQQPSTSNSRTTTAMTSSNTSNRLTPPDSDDEEVGVRVTNENPIECNNNHQEEEDHQANSQSSSVIFEGEYDAKANKNIPCVDVLSDNEDERESSDNNASQRNNDRPPHLPMEVNDGDGNSDDIIQDNEVPSDPSPENRPDYTSSDSNSVQFQDLGDAHVENYQSPRGPVLDLPGVEPVMVTPDNKVENWRKRYLKRVHSKDDEQATPGSSKTSRIESPKVIQPAQRGQETPAKSSVISSTHSAAPIKILKVYSVPADNSSSSGGTPPSPSSKTNNNAKKVILNLKEADNSDIEGYINKKNWRKALDTMNVDLSNRNQIPKAQYIAILIRRAVLCDGTRVAKKVQSDCVEFLHKLVVDYPPNVHPNSILYYRTIFEKVFEDAENPNDDVARLYQFFTELCARVEEDIKTKLETNTLWLLIFVTDLVVKQFLEYSEQKVKVKPALFHLFVQQRDASKLCYEPSCKQIIERLFRTNSPEMRCIYMKWLNLIVRSFGSSGNYLLQRENDYLILDVAEKCASQQEKDLGLWMLINLDQKEFGCKVCEAIFDKLGLTLHNPNNAQDPKKKRNEYLKKLSSDTMLLKPADGVIKDLCTQTCTSNPNLTYERTMMEIYQDGPKVHDVKRKNVKGETRLHTLCNTNTMENPLDEIRKHVRNNPGEINQQDNYGNTPLHDCAHHDKGNILKELMHLYIYEDIKEPPVNFLIRNKSLETPMHLAAVDSSFETVELLKEFASKCGKLEDVLLAANANGEIPFNVGANKVIINTLKPKGYSFEMKTLHNNHQIFLSSQSISLIKSSFPLRKIIAWWSRNKS